jgi:hypothetical protein
MEAAVFHVQPDKSGTPTPIHVLVQVDPTGMVISVLLVQLGRYGITKL